MQNSTPLSYALELVRSLDRDRFMACLFAPAPLRESLFTLYALEAELRHVHSAVTEEMNGHIRYAWWQESLEGIREGKGPRAHPVIESLAGMLARQEVPYETLSMLVTHYRESFPQMPPPSRLMDDAVIALLQKNSPEAAKGFCKAQHIIESHRARYGKKQTLWLQCKLLWWGLVG